MKRLLFGLLFLPAVGFCGTLTINGSGTGNVTMNANPFATFSVYPATNTALFPFGLTVSSVTVSSNTILPGASFYQAGPINLSNTLNQTAAVNLIGSGSLSVSSNTTLSGATFYFNGPSVIANLMTPIAKYRRPNLRFNNTVSAFLEQGNGGTANASQIIFPDGSVYNETQAAVLYASVTVNANWGNGVMQGGIRPGESVNPSNAMESVYVLKSSATANTTDYVLVMSSITPTVNNAVALSVFFGTNTYVYVGAVRVGNNDMPFATAILSFVQAGNHTSLDDVIVTTAAAVATYPLRGIDISSSPANVTSFSWGYAAGVSSATVPGNFALLDWQTDGSGTTSYTQKNALGTFVVGSAFGVLSAQSIVTTVFNVPAIDGMQSVTSGTAKHDLCIIGWTDSALGVGSNPLF